MSEDDGRIHFTYWSDPLCVWAFVAQPKLDHMISEFGDLLDVQHRVVPVFGSLPWRFSEGPWAKEGVEGRAAATRKVAGCFGHENVSGQVWIDDTPASSWSPGVAIKAAFAMEASGTIAPRAAAAYQWRLRQAFFVENRNISRRSVQLEVAGSCHIPIPELERSLDDGSGLALLWEDHRAQEASNVRGSPTYVFDEGREILYGNVAEGIIHATIEELRRGMGPGRSEC